MMTRRRYNCARNQNYTTTPMPAIACPISIKYQAAATCWAHLCTPYTCISHSLSGETQICGPCLLPMLPSLPACPSSQRLLFWDHMTHYNPSSLATTSSHLFLTIGNRMVNTILFCNPPLPLNHIQPQPATLFCMALVYLGSLPLNNIVY